MPKLSLDLSHKELKALPTDLFKFRIYVNTPPSKNNFLEGYLFVVKRVDAVQKILFSSRHQTQFHRVSTVSRKGRNGYF